MNRTTTRLFLVYLSIILIPILVLLLMGAVSIAVNQQYISRQVQKANTRTLDQIGNSIGMTFDELDALNLSFSTSPEFLKSLNSVMSAPERSFEESRILATLRNIVDVSAYARSYIQSLYVYIQNKSGRFLTSNDGVQTLTTYFDTSWLKSFESHTSQDMFWTELRTLDRFPGIDTGIHVLSVYRRVYSLIGITVPGVIVLNIDMSYFQRLLDDFKSTEDQKIAILDNNNHLIMSQINLPSAVFRRLEAGSGIVPQKNPPVVSIRGKDYVLTSFRAAKTGWTYASFTPTATYFGVSDTLRNFNLAIVALSFLLGLLVTVYISRRSFRHIESVIHAVSAAEEGNPLPPVPEHIDRGYSHITYSILRTFLEHKYLQVQLSERKYRQRTLELLALQSQMNPHFLFNTLETINWQAIELAGKPTQINDVIKSLSSILKYSLESPYTYESLKHEIKHAKDYLSIQRIRYRNKFVVGWNYDQSVCRFRIVRFVLQPLIENSIYHGIKEKAGKQRIDITIEKTGGDLLIRVQDTGLGIPGEHLSEIRRQLTDSDSYTENIGLYNTNRRIQLAFGDAYGLSIESEPGVGTTVSACIPAIVQENIGADE
jgi:two-component system sensor histidine kinase YesM